MNLHDYCIQHSEVTDPKKHGSLFDELPSDVSHLCDVAQGLILHYADEDIFQYKIPKNRFSEMDLRYVKNMLELILTYDSSALNLTRAAENRIVGVCRDNSVLICSVLRHKKIPSRLRVGFSDYIIPGLYLDGVCVEYWNQDKQKWCFVDTRTAKIHVEKFKINLDFDLHDLPSERFITAAEAWRLCRSKQVNPNRFGSRMHRGLWYVRNRLLQDFALLNKQEVLIWDLWGMMLCSDLEEGPSVPESQFDTLDNLSEFVNKNSYNIDAIHEYYRARDFLHMPDVVLVDNPFGESTTTAMSR